MALESGDSFVRTHADDTAMALNNWGQELPTLVRIFSDFQAASHLALSVDKCIFVPLFQKVLATTRISLQHIAPFFGKGTIQDDGKYLGFYVGQNKKDPSWSEAFNIH